MENILQRVDTELKEAMKARDELKLSVTRMLKSSLKNKSIDKMAALTDDEIIAVISSLVKQRRESIEQYSAAGRKDLADKEQRELEILHTYLPKQLSPEEIDIIINAAIVESGAVSANDIGKIMKIVAPKTKGLADGKAVNQRVKELLSARS